MNAPTTPGPAARRLGHAGSAQGPDLSRGFPGLRVWLTFKMYGTRKLEAAIAEKRDLAAWAAATRDVLARVLARGRVMLTGCTVDGRFLARVCVPSFRTRRDRVGDAVRHVAEETGRILAARVKP